MSKALSAGRKKEKPVRARMQTQPDCAGLARLPIQNPNPVLECNPTGQIIYTNPAAEHLLKTLSPASLLPANFSQLVQRCLREKTDITCQESQAGDRALLWSLHPATEGDRVHLYAADITERKRAEEALKHSEERYRELVEHANDIIYSIDLEGNFTSMNKAGERISGYTRQEFLRMNISHLLAPDLLAPDFLILARRNIASKLAGAPPATYELEIVTKDGRRVSLEANARPTYQDGKPTGVQGIARDTTERKRAEEMLRMTQFSINHAADAAFWFGPNAQIFYVNDAACLSLGYVRQELLSMTIHDIDPEYPVETWAEAWKAIKKDRFRTSESRHRTKGGREFPVEITVNYLEFGGQEYVCAFARDITERKRAEDELRLSEERFRKIFNHSRDAIFVTDPVRGEILDVNSIACSLFQFSRQELLSKNMSDIYPHEMPRLLALAESVQRSGQARTEELTCMTKSGQTLAAEIRASFIIDTSGQLRIVAFVRDIRERVQSEQKLEERRVYLNALIENSPLAIVVTDPESRAEMFNPAAEGLFQYRKEEIIGKLVDDIVLTGELYAEGIEITRRIQAGETFQATTRRRRKDGSLVDVDLYALPLIIDGEHVGTYALYRDITETKLLEDQLRQSQKMEAVGRLAGGVAHDFNNMLMVIRGYAELLLSRLTQDDPLYANCAEIKKAADRATSLTQQLLAFSRKQMLQPKVLSLNTLVADMEKMLQRLIGEDIEMVTRLGPELGQVKADPGQMEQVILNLAVNSRDAMPQGGKLTIETDNVELDRAYASQHPSAQPGPHVMLAVSDTGCGMDAKTRARIFEPFFTTKEKDKGTGLGLATLYGIVKQSGGNIWVYSEPGRGTTFKIYLPRVEESCQETGAGKSKLEEVSALGTVLVVEDEEGVRKIACEFLRTSGYTVLEARHGAEALQVAEQHPEPIHVMVTDVVMPGMSGRALAHTLEPLRPKMEVLYVSGYAENAIVHHGVIDGDMSFLQKPISLKGLVKRVEELIEAGGLRSDRLPARPQNMRQNPVA